MSLHSQCRVSVSGFDRLKPEPDMSSAFAIILLAVKCRVCRVIKGGDTAQEIAESARHGRLDHNTLIRLDLNDVRD